MRCGKSTKKCVFLVVLLVSILTACVGFFILQGSPRAEPTLRFVSIIHRHGERSPTKSYPSDPYKGEQFWPDGLGELLQKGKVNMYKFGCFLRERYGEFLSPAYTPEEIYVFSRNKDRCIMSAELVLAGLYPPVGKQVWNSDLPWQPVPVHSTSPACDDMMATTKKCALLSKENQERDNFTRKKIEENQEFVANLSQNTGSTISTVIEANLIFDNLLVVEQNGLQLPEWARQIYPDKLNSLAKIEYLELFKTPTMIKLESGVFINDILSNMKRKADTTKPFKRRLNLYSASDRTLIRLWRGLNISQEVVEKPYYGAALIVELHEFESEYRVRILHKKGTDDNNLFLLKTRGCEKESTSEQDGMCKFVTFSAALQSAVITDFDEACQNPK